MATASIARLHTTPYGIIEEQGPAALLADHATEFTLRHLSVEPGSQVAEPGCGTGVLSLCAALAGAALVTGTDVDPEALDAARLNAQRNRLANARFLCGSLLEPVAAGLHLVIALLPHKPAPRAVNLRYYGGVDGTDLLLATIRQSAERLVPGGRLLLYVNSIANPARVQDEFGRCFDVRVLGE